MINCYRNVNYARLNILHAEIRIFLVLILLISYKIIVTRLARTMTGLEYTRQFLVMCAMIF
jgi:hypothetical protein